MLARMLSCMRAYVCGVCGVCGYLGSSISLGTRACACACARVCACARNSRSPRDMLIYRYIGALGLHVTHKYLGPLGSWLPCETSCIFLFFNVCHGATKTIRHQNAPLCGPKLAARVSEIRLIAFLFCLMHALVFLILSHAFIIVYCPRSPCDAW